jgi:hypothetical protein
MSSEWVSKLKVVLEEVERAHESVNRASFEVGSLLQEQGPSALTEGEMVDVGYLFKRAGEMLDDARKECNHKKEQLGRVLAAIITRRALQDGTDAVARGELASATPDVKMRATIPRKGTSEYDALMTHFGVRREFLESGALSLHWSHLSDWLTEAAARGEKVPPGITTLRPDATVSYRRIKQHPTDKDD